MTKVWAVVVLLAAVAACSSGRGTAAPFSLGRSGPPPEHVARAAAPVPDPDVSEGSGDVDVVVMDQVGWPIPEATIVATSPNLHGSSDGESDDAGRARLSRLPPGAYEVVLYYGSIQLKVTAVVVAGSATRIDFRIDTRALGYDDETAAVRPDPIQLR